MDGSTLIALVGGPVLSALIAYILGLGFSKRVGTALTFLVCVLFALGETILEGKVAVGPAHDALGIAQLVVTNAFVVLGSAYMTYQHILQPLGVADQLNAIGPQVGVPQGTAPVVSASPTPTIAPVPQPSPTQPVIVVNVLPGAETQAVTDAIAEAVTAHPPQGEPVPVAEPVAPPVAAPASIPVEAPVTPPPTATRGYSPTPPLA